jgi:glycosyltransferase involved in cell wall biosynthesis
MSSITLMIPALNEEKRIGNTLENVLKVIPAGDDRRVQILVIDDGSTDGTAKIIADYARHHQEITLLRHDGNRGLGQALRTALAHATGEKFLIVPGDNDMPAATLSDLIRHAHSADMVMCFFPDRQFRGRGRRILSALFGFIYAACFDVHVQYINGPCVYPVARLRELELFSSRFSIVAEINVKLLRQGVSFIEIPGHRQVGLEGSSSFSLRNLREVTAVFLRLFYEIHLRNPQLYQKRPVRVRRERTDPDSGTAAPGGCTPKG